MKRDLNQLSKLEFDILIIGGGSHGAAVAYEMASSGLKTALIEQKDFLQATSSNSLKTIHGGLRYLQHLNLKRMRESIKSRREIMDIAPHLVKPLPCLMPTYGHGLKGKEVMRIALLLNDLISWDRNYGIEKKGCLKRGRILSKESCLKHLPDIKRDSLNGAALWYDAIAVNTEKLTLTFILKAVERGALVANYVQAKGLIIHDNTIIGVKAKDFITGDNFDIRAKMVVNATGPWMENLLPFSGIKNQKVQSWAKAVNIIVKKPLFDGYAVGLEGSKEYMDRDAVLRRGKRLFFLVPWRGYTIIGTSYKEFKGKPDQLRIDKEDIKELIEEANNIYPPAELTFNDVTYFHYGLVPMVTSDKNISFDIQLDKHTVVIDHEKTGNIKGLLTIKSVKYTTAPQTAKHVKNIIKKKKMFSKMKRADSNRVTAGNYLASQGKYKPEKINSIGKFDILKHLQSNYGSYCKELLNYIEKDEKLASLISYNPPLTVVEVLYGIREEMAFKLADIVFRRTELGTAERPPKDVLIQIADIMAEELVWDEIRKTDEIREVLDCYSPLYVEQKLTL